MKSLRIFIIIWTCYAAILVTISMWLLPAITFDRLDFHCFYAAGYLARTHPDQLYDLPRQISAQLGVAHEAGWAPFVQPPYEALVILPFSLLPYRSAYLLFLVCNICLIPLSFLLARCAFSRMIDPWQPYPGLMFFVFLPMSVAILNGQAAMRILFICCAVWHELEREKPFNAGLILALALFKFQIILPLALLLAVRYGLAFLAGFSLTTALLGLTSAWLTGWRGLLAFGKLLVSFSLVRSDSALTELTVSYSTSGLPSIHPLGMPNLRGLLSGLFGRVLPHIVLMGVIVLVSIAVLIWTVHRMRMQRDEEIAFALAVIGALLVSYHLNYHDLTLLLLPIALVSGHHWPHLNTMIGACFIVPVLVAPFALDAGFLMALPALGLLILAAFNPAQHGTSLFSSDQVRHAGTGGQ